VEEEGSGDAVSAAAVSRPTGPELVTLGGLTVDEYHSDPAPAPSLSASIAKVLVEQSPMHAWSQHPRLGGVQAAPTEAMEDGTVLHRLLLGKGAEFVSVAANDWKTKAAKAARAAARAAGKVAVLERKLSAAMLAAEKIRERALERGIDFSAGENELAVVWREPNGVYARAMIDHVEGALIVDVKKTTSAHPEDAAKSVVNYGYDIQRAAYVRALEVARPELAGRVEFAFLFCETKPPYAVQLAQLDGAFRMRGERLWSEAVAQWGACLSEGRWPGYEQPAYLAAPGWLLAREGLGA
jgi:hypothetical protein